MPGAAIAENAANRSPVQVKRIHPRPCHRENVHAGNPSARRRAFNPSYRPVETAKLTPQSAQRFRVRGN